MPQTVTLCEPEYLGPAAIPMASAGARDERWEADGVGVHPGEVARPRIGGPIPGCATS
jgi:hypothetical protein